MPRNVASKIQPINIHEESKYFEDAGWQIVEEVDSPLFQKFSIFKLPPRFVVEPYFQLLGFISIDIWEILKIGVERELLRRASITKNLTSTTELQEFLAVQMLLNVTFANNTKSIRKHLFMVKEKFLFEMGFNRWTLLRCCLVPTNTEVEKICALLKNNFFGFLDSVCTFYIF